MTTDVSATVRVDTFTPSEKVITFFMTVTQSVFTSLETTFLSQLADVFQDSATNYVIKRWCIEEETARCVILDDTVLFSRCIFCIGICLLYFI